MPRVLFLASDLGASAPATFLTTLIPTLGTEFTFAVVDLDGKATPGVLDLLQAHGVPVWSAPMRSWADVRGLREVRRCLAAFAPDVLHTLGGTATAAGGLFTLPGLRLPASVRRVVSGADRADASAGWLIRRFCRSAVALAPTHAESERYRVAGIVCRDMIVVPPAVVPASALPEAAEFRRSLGLPAESRLIFAAGRFDSTAALKSAVWAFDVVKYVAADIYLVLVGDGPERERLARFAQALGFDDHRVRFLGLRDDLPALLNLAELVWVTHEQGGVPIALEAMAAGKPVVAQRTPDLAEIVQHGVTGILTTVGDKVQLAAAANGFLEDPIKAQAFGDAGRRRAAEVFSIVPHAKRVALVYHGLASVASE